MASLFTAPQEAVYRQKSKQEEIDQFKAFVASVEPDGYLASILTGMAEWVEEQIRWDMGLSPLQLYRNEQLESGRARQALALKTEEAKRLEAQLEQKTRQVAHLQNAIDAAASAAWKVV